MPDKMAHREQRSEVVESEQLKSENTRDSLKRVLKSQAARNLVDKFFDIDLESPQKTRAAKESQTTDFEDMRKKICSAISSYAWSVADIVRQKVDANFQIGQDESSIRNFIRNLREVLSSSSIFGIRAQEVDTVMLIEAKEYIKARMAATGVRDKVLRVIDQPTTWNEYFPAAIFGAQDAEKETIKPIDAYELIDKHVKKWVEGNILRFFGSSWGAGAAIKEDKYIGELLERPIAKTEIDNIKDLIKRFGLNQSRGDIMDLFRHLDKWIEKNVPELARKSPELQLLGLSDQIVEDRIAQATGFVRAIVMNAVNQVAKEGRFESIVK